MIFSTKKLLLLPIVLLLLSFHCQSQNIQLWGMTLKGGSDTSGVLFRIFNNGTRFQNMHTFVKATGNYPKGNLININGNIYGMTDSGGTKGGGVIFKFDPAYNIYSVLFNFDSARTNVGVMSGKYPGGSLFYYGNNIVYGMANGGGSNKKGVIFKFDISTNTYTKVYNFDGTDGQFPTGNLILATDGKLYGMTPLGGQYTDGVIFSFDPTTNTFTKMFDFNGGEGANPRGSLIQAIDGNLYGLTYGGGDSSRGIIFTINPVNNSFGNVFTFHGINGAYPYNSLLQANDLKLYGTILSNPNGYNSGSVFSHNLSTHYHADVLSFPSHSFGHPYGNVIQASDGLLYGMTYHCLHDSTVGADSAGVLFSINITNNACSVLHVFNSIDGANPCGDLLEMPVNTGIKEPAENSVHVSFYPNPVSGIATLELINGKDESYSLRVNNLLGKEVLSIINLINGGTINLSSLPKGMYFYKLINKDKLIKIEKFIIE